MSTRTPATEGQAKIREALTAMRKHFGENDRTQYEHRMSSLADEALSLLNASPPIVGELTENQYRVLAERMVEEHRKYGNKMREGHWAEIAARKVVSHMRDFGYLAQAPQSSPTPGVKPDGIMNEGYIEATRAHGSPAPSVIEVGDAMENMMRRLRTQRDDEGILPTGNDFNGMDGLCAAWVAAKASRPSVTAPQGVTEDQIKGVISEVDDMHPYKVAGNADSYSSYNEGWSDACGIIEGRLSALLTK